MVTDKNQGLECCCSNHDGQGFSTCGILCPVYEHALVAYETLRDHIRLLYKELINAYDDINRLKEDKE